LNILKRKEGAKRIFLKKGDPPKGKGRSRLPHSNFFQEKKKEEKNKTYKKSLTIQSSYICKNCTKHTPTPKKTGGNLDGVLKEGGEWGKHPTANRGRGERNKPSMERKTSSLPIQRGGSF